MLCHRGPPECRHIAGSIATNLCEQRSLTTTASSRRGPLCAILRACVSHHIAHPGRRSIAAALIIKKIAHSLTIAPGRAGRIVGTSPIATGAGPYPADLAGIRAGPLRNLDPASPSPSRISTPMSFSPPSKGVSGDSARAAHASAGFEPQRNLAGRSTLAGLPTGLAVAAPDCRRWLCRDR